MDRVSAHDLRRAFALQGSLATARVAGMSWLVRIPYRVAPGRSFETGVIRLAGYDWTLKTNGSWYVLFAQGLPDEAQARAIVPHVVAALIWAGALSTDGIQASADIQEIKLGDKPSPPQSMLPGVYGFANEGRPAVYPDDKRVAFGAAGEVGVLVSTPFKEIRGEANRSL
jgi:hypothetical protein